jgi:hypothetical protein
MKFETRSPVPHTVVDDWSPTPLLISAAKTWPDERWQWWHKYDDATAIKFATMGGAPFPPACSLLLDSMATIDVSPMIPDAFPDLMYHAGGMHLLPAGGFLAPHIDAEIHPLTGWSRVLNAILFVEGDGDLCLGSDYRIAPKPGRLVIFATKDCTHAVIETTKQRKTLAAYWWADRQQQGGSTRAVFS